MIKERLHELEIKITELASYLNVSRPTIYKAIEDYDSNRREMVNAKILSLFDYIGENEMIGKGNVIKYILNDLPKVEDRNSGEISSSSAIISQFINDNPSSEKAKFLVECAKSQSYDTIIHYFMEISPILKKEKITEEEKEMIRPYEDIIKIYSINKGGKKQ